MSQYPGSPQDGGQPTPPPPGGSVYGQSYGQGQPYAPAASGYETPSYGYGAPRSTNVLAIVSLVTSLLGIGIVGIITGHMARRQIRQTGEGGDGLALAGLIIGYVVTVISVVVFAAFIGLFAVGASQGVGMG